MRQTCSLLLLSLALLRPAVSAAQADPTSRSWNQPVEPYRIAGNLYYVGASDITLFLVTTPEGQGGAAPQRGGEESFYRS